MTLCQPGELSDLRHAGARQRVVARVVSRVEPRLTRNITRYRRVLAFTLYPVDSVRVQINYKRLSTIGRYYYLKRVRLNTNHTIHNAQNYYANFASPSSSSSSSSLSSLSNSYFVVHQLLLNQRSVRHKIQQLKQSLNDAVLHCRLKTNRAVLEKHCTTMLFSNMAREHGCLQDAELSQRDRAAGCVRVLAKSGRLELGDKSAISLRRGPADPTFQVEGVAPHQPLFFSEN